MVGHGSDLWLGLTGAVRMVPYVVLSVAAGILADRLSRARVLRWSAGVRAVLLAGCALALLADQLGVAVVLAALTVAAGRRRTRPGSPCRRDSPATGAVRSPTSWSP